MPEINEVAVYRCPFCGSGDFDVLVATGTVVCTNDSCLAAGPPGDTILQGVEKWNTRPQVKHLEHVIEVHMDVIDKLVARVKRFEAQATSVCERGVSREHEHMWRTSPEDAGYTFCCLCGIERED